MVPLIHPGEDSAWYMGTRHEIIPTPRPANTRPATNRLRAVAPVCMATPKKKTPHAPTIPQRRPMKSPIGAAKRAPKKVPSERIDTTRDSLGVEIRYPPLPSG
jgi:hypothetical protein